MQDALCKALPLLVSAVMMGVVSTISQVVAEESIRECKKWLEALPWLARLSTEGPTSLHGEAQAQVQALDCKPLLQALGGSPLGDTLRKLTGSIVRPAALGECTMQAEVPGQRMPCNVRFESVLL